MQPAIGTAFRVWVSQTEILPTFVDPTLPVNPNKTAIFCNLPSKRAYSVSLQTTGIRFTGLKIVASATGERPLMVSGDTTFAACDIAVRGTALSGQVSGNFTLWGGTYRIGGANRSLFSGTSTNRLSLYGVILGVIGEAGSTSSVAFNFAAANATADGFMSGTFVGVGVPVFISNETYRCNLSLVTSVFGATHSVFVSGPSMVTVTDGDVVVTGGQPNQSWITVQRGARVRIAPTAIARGTTELSVDGVTSTLAAMRANNPKIFPLTPNPYGTYVFE